MAGDSWRVRHRRIHAFRQRRQLVSKPSGSLGDDARAADRLCAELAERPGPEEACRWKPPRGTRCNRLVRLSAAHGPPDRHPEKEC